MRSCCSPCLRTTGCVERVKQASGGMGHRVETAARSGSRPLPRRNFSVYGSTFLTLQVANRARLLMGCSGVSHLLGRSAGLQRDHPRRDPWLRLRHANGTNTTKVLLCGVRFERPVAIGPTQPAARTPAEGSPVQPLHGEPCQPRFYAGPVLWQVFPSVADAPAEARAPARRCVKHPVKSG